ncbi:NAD(P)H-dependent oxidoreductase [Limibacter armeniacum]|uniref:flavodoxin family protein n=1 Tax=Limibacter armeniacum TaxID=466084 RepID=UPI002FE68501
MNNSKTKAIIILGSARSDGNTSKITSYISEKFNIEIIDLLEANIGFFDYNFHNQHDDFLSIAEKMLDHQLIIFATPVYWYSMSGVMKNFFDRFTDLLLLKKDLGKKFHGKDMFIVSCGSSETPIEGFFMPFEKTSEYLKMNYKGGVHTWFDKQHETIPLKAKRQLEKLIRLLEEKVPEIL